MIALHFLVAAVMGYIGSALATSLLARREPHEPLARAMFRFFNRRRP